MGAHCGAGIRVNRRGLLKGLGLAGLAAVAAPLVRYEPKRRYFFGGWRPADSQFKSVLVKDTGEQIWLPTWNLQSSYTATLVTSIKDAALYDSKSGQYIPLDKRFGSPVHLVNGDSLIVTYTLNLT